MKRFIFALALLTSVALLTGCSSESSADVSEEAYIKLAETRFNDYDFSTYSEPIQYNENPDISFKPLPEAYSIASYGIPFSTLDLLKDSDGTAIIHILNETEVVEYSLTGDPELDAAIGEKTGNSSFATSTREIKKGQVIYNVYGEQEIGEILDISMYDKGWGTELTEGKDYIIILRKLASGRYNAIDGINSIYEIKDDFTVVSQSPMYESAKYDGLPLADIVHDFAVNNEIRMENLKAQEESLVIE